MRARAVCTWMEPIEAAPRHTICSPRQKPPLNPHSRHAPTKGPVLKIGLRLPIALCVGIVAISAFLVAPASANWFGPTGVARSVNEVYKCGGGNITDDKDVSFYYDPVTPADVRGVSNWVRTDLLNPTALDTSLQSTPNNDTDVYLIAQNYTDWCEAELGIQWTTNGTTGLHGVTNCEVKDSSTPRCAKANVRLSTLFFGAHDAPGDRWLVCHEVGHAIGLRHRQLSSSCMATCSTHPPFYTTHDIAHFNANWVTEPADGVEPTC